MTPMQIQLQRAGRLFFDRLPPPLQQQLREVFRSMDLHGNARISLPELVRWVQATTLSHPSVIESGLRPTFAFVDSDGNGTLDFEECKGLFFILCTASRSCDGCANVLLETAYTCADCNLTHSLTNMVHTFDLCTSCYAIFMNPLPFLPRNPKLTHPHRNLVEHKSELAAAIDDIINQVQCAVCKEYHKRNAQGLFLQRHVRVGRGPQERTVCEWCIACLCPGCGNHFEGPQEVASKGRWAIRNNGTCMSCRQRGIMGASPFNAFPFSPETLTRMDTSPMFEECRTCKTKASDGSLATAVIQALNTTPRGGMFGTNYTSSPFNVFGSNGFGQMLSSNPLGNNSFTGSSSFTTPSFNSMGSFGGSGSGSNLNGFMNMANSVLNNGSSGGGTGSSFDMLNAAGNPFDVLNNMGGTGIGSGNPLDMLNNMGGMGLGTTNPLDTLNNMGGMGLGTGNPLDTLNNMGGIGLGSGNPLDMLNMVGNMGNALDLANLAGMCSIM